MTNPTFDMQAAIQALRDGKGLSGKDGILTPLIKQLTEAAMQAELEQHLEQGEAPNRKNGSSAKTMKSTAGSFELNTPRDRAGSFEPQIVKKHQTQLTDELERKIIGLFALGTSYQDIRAHIEEMYGISISNGTLNAVTDKLLPELQAWRERELDPIYPIVWLDAIHYKIKENSRYITKAVYTILGVTVEGKKELLGLYLSEHEGAHHWLTVLTDLYNRGVKDILIACVDGLKGFTEAINSVFPQTIVQLCIVHMVRNSLNYVPWKDRKLVAADLKAIYSAANAQSAELALAAFRDKWDNKYPTIGDIWQRNWQGIIPFLSFPDDIRKAIYTTNAIEAINRQIRKIIKSKGCFSSDEAVFNFRCL